VSLNGSLVVIDPERQAKMTLRLLWSILALLVALAFGAGLSWGEITQRVKTLEENRCLCRDAYQQWPPQVQR
jgi:hypothetical protein